MIRSLALALALAFALPGVALAADPTPVPAVPTETLGAPCPPVEYVNGVPVIPEDAPSDCMYIQGGGMLGGEQPSIDPCAPLADGSVPEMCQSAPMPIDATDDLPADGSCVTDENGQQVCATLYDTVGGPGGADLHGEHMKAANGLRASELILALFAVLAGLVGYLFGARSRAAKNSTPDQQ